MKTIRTTITLLALVALAVSSCKPEEKETPDPVLVAAEVQNVGTALEVNLDEQNYIDLIWSAASWNGDGIVTYTVLIDTENGDFSDPVMILNPALETQSISVTESRLTQLYEACAETAESETAVAKWAVRSSAGGQRAMSSSQLISMSRSNKPAEPEVVEFALGASIFAAGDAALESGQEMTYLVEHPFVTTAEGYQDLQGLEMTPEYEFFTRIDAGKEFYLTYGSSSDKADGYLSFGESALNAVSDLVIGTEKPESVFTASTAGIYRVRINATEKKALIQSVDAVVLRFFGREKNAKGKWAQSVTTDVAMDYQGNGVWKASSVEMRWGNTSFAARYDTYKIAMTLNGAAQLYGAQDNTVMSDGSNPTKDTQAKYWALQTVQGGAVVAKGAFRIPMWLLDEGKNPAYTADVTLYMNFEKGDYYYHEFTGEKAVSE